MGGGGYNERPMANRYFLPTLPTLGPCTLAGDLAHHLGRVLRVRGGDGVVLGDGRGGTALAVVQTVERSRIGCVIESTLAADPAPLRVTLAFAVPKLQRVEWLLEHGTEVGVTTFAPLWTTRTRPVGERLDRWQRIVTAAAGQCDRAWLPTVLAGRELTAMLADTTLPTARVLAAAGAPGLQSDGARRGEVVLLVGPEGGFDDAEMQAIAAAGFAARSFGQHTLRTETAALVGAAILLAT